MNKNEKVCFVLTHVPNPRINKRIAAFKKNMPVEVLCARRKSQNVWEPEHLDIEHAILDVDLPRSSQLIKRVITSYGFRKRLYALLEEKRPTIVYSEGLDTLMVAVKYKKQHGCKLIFEVADLREAFIEKPRNFVKRCITCIISMEEKLLFKSIDKLVITSPKFYEKHYCELISRDNTVFAPNAPELVAFHNYKPKHEGPFTVGFIGGIRYLTQMKMLVDVASELEINVIFAGAGNTNGEYAEIQAYCKDLPNVCFTGRYDYSSDIANLYGLVDCVYAVYNADNPNVKIALPNKLYEATYCKLPIIVAKDTYLEEIVKEWGVGVSVGHTNPTELKNALIKLKEDKEFYNTISKACEQEKKEIVKLQDFDIADVLLKE